MLEEAKTPFPEECLHLDYLLATPFRYRPYPSGSRFRRAGLTPGVWYGAERPETAAAEMVFYRFLFYAESPETPFPDDAAGYTVFAARVATDVSLDLMAGALAERQALWIHPTDYALCQDPAEAARMIGTEILSYRSVRDPGHGANLAIMACQAFAIPYPIERQTWRIRISTIGGQAIREHPRLGLEYPADTFEADPRLATMVWHRPRA
jgi:hypothetical protein